MAASSGISDAVGGVISAAVSGGAGLLSGWTAGGEAKKARKWQAIRYRRRYQDTVRDLRLAGLNPILAAGSAQVGGMPGSPETADYSKAADLLSEAVPKGINAAIAVNSARKMKADAQNAEAEAQLKTAETNYKLTGGSVRTKDGEINYSWRPPYQEAIDAGILATKSSAESNSASARLADARATLPPAEIRQIDNAIANANVSELTKLLVNAGVAVVGDALNMAKGLIAARSGGAWTGGWQGSAKAPESSLKRDPPRKLTGSRY